MLLVPLIVVAGSSAVAKAPKASKNVTLQMKGKISVKRNKFLTDTARFSPGVVLIRSGGTLTLKNRQEEPHTFSVVQKSQLPRTTNKILDCGSPGTICDTLFQAHQPDAEGNPTLPVVDVGAPGIDQPGDSIVLNPKQTLKVKVSAPKGKTLQFLCGIHAWMQGQVKSR